MVLLTEECYWQIPDHYNDILISHIWVLIIIYWHAMPWDQHYFFPPLLPRKHFSGWVALVILNGVIRILSPQSPHRFWSSKETISRELNKLFACVLTVLKVSIMDTVNIIETVLLLLQRIFQSWEVRRICRECYANVL